MYVNLLSIIKHSSFLVNIFLFNVYYFKHFYLTCIILNNKKKNCILVNRELVELSWAPTLGFNVLDSYNCLKAALFNIEFRLTN